MNTKIALQELAIVLAVKDQNPQSLNLDFLKYSGIVAADWELAQPAVQSPQYTRLVFQNNIHIVAQVNTLTFVQPIVLSDPSSLKVPELAHRYVRSLPHIEYLAMGVSPKSLITLGSSASAPDSSYIVDSLLPPNHWQHGSHRPAQAAITLSYPLDRCMFRLTVEDVKHKPADQPETGAVLVSGNFHYPVTEVAGDRLLQLHRFIDNWKIDLKTYLEIVNQRFLSKKGTAASTRTSSKTTSTKGSGNRTKALETTAPSTKA